MNSSDEWIGRPSGSESIPDIAYVHISEPRAYQRGYSLSLDSSDFYDENNYTVLSGT